MITQENIYYRSLLIAGLLAVTIGMAVGCGRGGGGRTQRPATAPTTTTPASPSEEAEEQEEPAAPVEQTETSAAQSEQEEYEESPEARQARERLTQVVEDMRRSQTSGIEPLATRRTGERVQTAEGQTSDEDAANEKLRRAIESIKVTPGRQVNLGQQN